MMKSYYLIISVLLIPLQLLMAQPLVDYNNKSLDKSLKMFGYSGIDDLQQFMCADSLGEAQNSRYFMIEDTSGHNPVCYVYVGRVNSCRAGGCSNELSSPINNLESEYFDYYILFNPKKQVSMVKVFNYQATHGYEICAKGWLKQFIGYRGKEELKVGKEIDAISGATISVYAITSDVEKITKTLIDFKK